MASTQAWLLQHSARSSRTSGRDGSSCQRGLQVGNRGLELLQAVSVKLGPMEEQMCVIRPKADGVGQVVDGFRQAVQLAARA